MSAYAVDSLEWRLVGPFRGGRVVAVAGDPTDAAVFYFGSAGGGVWKTTDGGYTWRNRSDRFFHRASVGAIAIAPSDPNVIYAGMGETTIRNNVSHGDGVYRSTDGGATWQHLGLSATRHIGAVCVHPDNTDCVYVAAFGHAHGPNAERGVYRSTDGGATWAQIAFRGVDAGAHHLQIDPRNSRILYAAFWEARRGPYYLSSGGPGSGLLKSTDGGDTWQDLTDAPGMPRGLKGKIEIAVSSCQSGRVWAMIEAAEGGVFRSEDGGAHWTRLTDDINLRQRPWYFGHIRADPSDADTVWVLNIELWKSIDGGKTFDRIPVAHGDQHDLWFDPRNPQRMILGNDGGGSVSFTGGRSWSTTYNQPTAELYRVATDARIPYRLYAAQQDNTTIGIPSRSRSTAITASDWYEVVAGESGAVAIRPDNPDIVFAGDRHGRLTRYDHATGNRRDISAWPEHYRGGGACDWKYRFAWTSPVMLSPHDPDTLYVGSNIVHRSMDEGTSWTEISPDLTRNDPTTQGPSGGPITKDNGSAEIYGTIFALAESPVQQGLIWAGSDDGLVHVSRDGGDQWREVTPPDIAPWALISCIEPSPFHPGTAYVAATRYKLDDFTPYLFGTYDFGETWIPLRNGIAGDDFVRVIRADPARSGWLFAGTETGIYLSTDDGAQWRRLGGNLPVVPIHDIAITGDDLVVATHGRSFWILDDLTQLEPLTATATNEGIHLWKPRDGYRFASGRGLDAPAASKQRYWASNGKIVTANIDADQADKLVPSFRDAGANAVDGVAIYYVVRAALVEPAELTIRDARGKIVRHFQGDEISTHIGANRFVWDMRHAPATPIATPGGDQPRMSGPLVPPGLYQVELVADIWRLEQSFAIHTDPAVPLAQEGFEAQYALLLRIRDCLSALNGAVNRIRSLRVQLEQWEQRAQGTTEEVGQEARSIAAEITEIEGELLQTRIRSPLEMLSYPVKLNNKLVWLAQAVGQGASAPTTQAYALFGDLSRRVEEQLARLQAIVTTRLPALNALIHQSHLPALILDAEIPR